ncbi:hypothetical protein FSARC_8494 [Fusarium sarcochroum]|uniref:Acid phosphatase n=1 Tax=Fusarium sarcochroum TaxID=1208366 RepID=A0A8H4X6W5_9HYPO|nr:hypothetical protein FSARC_8494 [Fusarium sarcochroum]
MMQWKPPRQKHLSLVFFDPLVFAWHGGDLSYADDWYNGTVPCNKDWPVSYNGTSTTLPGKGEFPNQGSPRDGDMGVLYESNWGLWQQWMNNVTLKVPYMVVPGNHEATCADHDDPMPFAYLNEGKANSTSPIPTLNYYSCPPSQGNFTALQHRFHTVCEKYSGVGNFWYSFDYGVAHFVSIDTETDGANSPDKSVARDVNGDDKHPMANETHGTDAGPFGVIHGSYNDPKSFEQYQWLAKDPASVDRCKTPWVIVMGHLPINSSKTVCYQDHIRNAFQKLMLKNEVDLYIGGHVHWYERLYPLDVNGAKHNASVVSNHTCNTSPGKSMVHPINGAAGNIESHSTCYGNDSFNHIITAFLDKKYFGFSELTVQNATALS